MSESKPVVVSVMLVEVGVNDHAETVYRALLAPGWKGLVPDYLSRSAEPWRNDTTGSEPF